MSGTDIEVVTPQRSMDVDQNEIVGLDDLYIPDEQLNENELPDDQPEGEFDPETLQIVQRVCSCRLCKQDSTVAQTLS